MSIQDIERAVEELSPDELVQFSEWFARYHEQEWDKQIVEDRRAGRLDELISLANKEFDAGNMRRL
jgi:hypothetical protein